MSSIQSAVEYDLKLFDALFDHAYPTATTQQKTFARGMASDGCLAIETVLEQAIHKAGNLERNSVDGEDFIDGSDAKKVVSHQRYVMDNRLGYHVSKNSYEIRGIQAKTGTLRIAAYNKVADLVEFFAIPYEAYRGKGQVSICLSSDTGEVGWGGQYRKYRKKTLVEMATA